MIFPSDALVLGWRTLWRDLRAGELRLLVLAVLLAVAALSAVGFFADRLQGGLQRDARQLLGGDAVLASDNPPSPALLEQARALGLQVSTSVSFPTMGRASDAQGGAARLVALKAVEAGYPLRGSLRVASAPGQAGQVLQQPPTPGEAWVDPALLEALGLDVGDLLLLGDTSLRISRLILLESDRGASFLSFAPRVMIHQQDLPSTGLVQPASRVNWRLAVAGTPRAVQNFSATVQTQINQGKLRGARLESLESGRPEMRQTLDRAEKFLQLVALLAALLSAVAVALAARGFAAAHLNDCAMLRVLGQSQRQIAWAYGFEFMLVGLVASLLGVMVGYAVHHVFVLLLAGLVEGQLPSATLRPGLLGLGVGLTLLLSFGLPPVLQLAQVPPLRVIRREVGGLKVASVMVLGVGMAGFAGLLILSSKELTLGLIAVGGFAVAVALFALLSALAVWLLRRLVNESTAPRWLVLATRQIAARPAYAVVQVSALAVGLLALVLLVLLRTDLVDSWRRATPSDAPNRFVLNVMPDQGAAFQQMLRDSGVPRYDWYPMIRGRLIEVNGQPVRAEQYSEDRAKRLVEREFNLSYALQRPSHNEVLQGQWIEGEPGAVSVEEGLMQTLGLKLGDRLRFDIAGVQSNARISSVRKVDWGSLHANFFVMYPLAELGPQMPVTYLSAFKAPSRDGFDNALVRAFPNITSVDMSVTVAQVQRVLEQVVRAVEFLFGFTLAAGLVVLFAAVSATREERAREYAVMRAVGASARLLRQVQRAELIGIGLLAGTLAGVLATAIAWVLARQVFEFNWTAPLWVPLAGALAGALLTLAAGWWGLRELLRRPVMVTLRQASE